MSFILLSKSSGFRTLGVKENARVGKILKIQNLVLIRSINISKASFAYDVETLDKGQFRIWFEFLGEGRGALIN